MIASTHQTTGASSGASPKTQHSNRASPLSTTDSTTSVENGAMAAVSSFLPPAPASRLITGSAQGYPSNYPSYYQSFSMPGPFFGPECPGPIGTPFSTSPTPMIRALIRRLPLNTSEESLRLMVVWSQELADVELLSADQSEDKGFRSALLRFRSMHGALEAKRMLDGRSNISNDAEMIVEILDSSPRMRSSRRFAPDSATSHVDPLLSSTTSNSRRQSWRFEGPFPSLDRLSPTSSSAFPVLENSVAYPPSIFSPQSPIGNHLDRNRVSSKTLINNACSDDDETSDLLNNPLAYAENGAPAHRRATAPQIPVSTMTSRLSLNTSNPAGPSSLPMMFNSRSAHPSAMSPLNASPAGVSHPLSGGPHYTHTRSVPPPLNPADQNPPCNTLYVGNLPIDTSEEELKAMFSKQRGYKRLCFRTKQNGPMCFVEFEDISTATKALSDLYGNLLHNSVKGGIRLSFSKNPLGVRSGQAHGSPSHGANNNFHHNIMMMVPGPTNGYTPTNGPPPGLSVPPGLGSRGSHSGRFWSPPGTHSQLSRGNTRGANDQSPYGSRFNNHGSPSRNIGHSGWVPPHMLGL